MQPNLTESAISRRGDNGCSFAEIAPPPAGDPHPDSLRNERMAHENRSDWRWLEGTYWYCAAACMPAIRTTGSDTFSWVIDQTVWFISGYADGYFWGTCSALLTPVGQTPDASQKQDMTFFASITPQGQVHITFLSSPVSTTIGTGRTVARDGKTAFEMQMSSGPASSLVVHWAYMLQVQPGDPEWDDLPGAGVSVEAMVGDITPPQRG